MIAYITCDNIITDKENSFSSSKSEQGGQTMHDSYYDLPDSELLAKELDKYIHHIEQCLEEDGIRSDILLDMQAQLYSAQAVRANIKRVYED